MSTITSIQSNDVVADSRAVINTNFSNLNTDKVEDLSDLGLTKTASEYNDTVDAVASAFTMPSGAIMIWPTATAPTGWRLCDGAERSRTGFASLFAAIGTTYGVGDGSTTFNVPNLKGRVVVGIDASQTEFDTLAETGGAKTHTLTEAQIPAHTHVNADGIGDDAGSRFSSAAGAGKLHKTNIATNSTGGGEAHNNLQPYMALHYIIKE